MRSPLSFLLGHSHVWLLATLALLVGVQPFFYGTWFGRVAFRVLLFASIGAAGISCAKHRRQAIQFAILFAPTVVAGVIWWISDPPWAQRAYFVLSMVCIIYIIALILGHIFRTRFVSPDTIYAALSVYLLMGVMWTFLYMILEQTEGSFDFGSRAVDTTDDYQLFRTLLGFSYTTLTTLGYGNIAPKTVEADALTSMEAMIGQIYLTVLVARLVGIQVSQGFGHSEPEAPPHPAQPLRGDGPAGT